jgi:hypothetical protein
MRNQKLWALVAVGLTIAAIGAVYWLLDPSRRVSRRLQQLESASNPAEILETLRSLLLKPDSATQDILSRGIYGFIEPGLTPQKLAELQKTGVYRHYAGRIGPLESSRPERGRSVRSQG